jgi:hypothetical protein
MPPVFRESPPIELINECLSCIGLSGIDDFSTFSKQTINIQKFEECLPLLEPYYLPCKASDYLYKTPFTQNQILTILRQVLKVHGVGLKYFEKTIHNVKTTFYQLEIKVPSLAKHSDVTIAFE